MPPFRIDPAAREALQAHLRYYRELGIGEFYRREVDPAVWTPAEAPSLTPAGPASIAVDLAGRFAEVSEESAIPPRKSIVTPPPPAEALPPEQHFAALKLIRDDIGNCVRCKLCEGRNKIVFGDGDPNAKLMFVGEGPGADEDAQGLPFVGRGGQLLNNMIGAMGLKREEVYIANVVKCRPPANRTPELDEANTCSPFLFRQIDVVNPKVIVALGQTAVTYLTGEKRPLSAWRGTTHPLRGRKLVVTYHPAFLLRDPTQKRAAWQDLQIAMRELGLEPQRKA